MLSHMTRLLSLEFEGLQARVQVPLQLSHAASAMTAPNTGCSGALPLLAVPVDVVLMITERLDLRSK